MKKRLSLILILVIVFSFNVFPSFGLDTGLKVYDEAGLFTSSELSVLQESAQKLSSSFKLDVIVVTVDDAMGKSSEAFADDYFDYNGFGYGANADGLLMLIDMDNRNVWISTSGKAINIFYDSRIDAILDKVTPKLSDEQYANAAGIFLEQVEHYVESDVQPDSTQKYEYSADNDYDYNYPEDNYRYDYEPTPVNKFDRSVNNLLTFILIGIGVGGAAVGIMAMNNRGVKTVSSDTYLNSNSFNLTDNRDIYIRTAVTKRHIETNTGGSGGGHSSTHTGSSGRTHGGGGRSF